jgi:hypothetical protein
LEKPRKPWIPENPRKQQKSRKSPKSRGASKGAPPRRGTRRSAQAERRARPGEERLDVSFAPTRALADLAAHPPIRRAALALMGWPEDAVPLAAVELVADGAALEPLALRVGQTPICPSPLQRLRSTTAPPGVHRLLAGWSLQRQHAPWASIAWVLRSIPQWFLARNPP